MPDAVKFDAQGHIVSTQVASGQVLRIDPRSGERTVLADIAPGLDNLTLVGERLFVSSISGQINEVLGDGTIRALVPDGLNWPLGLALGEDGLLFVADGGFVYTLRPGGELQGAGMLFSPGIPGYTRGVAASRAGRVRGDHRKRRGRTLLARAKQGSEVLAEGFDQLYGVAVAPGGAVVFAEGGTGRVLSRALGRCRGTGHRSAPADGSGNRTRRCLPCFRIRSGPGGHAVRGRAETVLDGLQRPQGIVLRGALLYVVDALARELIEYDMASGARRTIAAGLPVGAPPGSRPGSFARFCRSRGHGPVCRHCGRSGRHALRLG